MAKTQTAQPVIEDSEPVVDPSAPAPAGLSAPRRTVVDEPRRPKFTRERFVLPEQPPEGVDPFRWRQEKGFPPPTRKYRVTLRSGTTLLEAHECYAVDEAEAVSFAFAARGITKDTHRYTSVVVELER